MRKGYFSDEEKEFIAANAHKYTRKELAQRLNRKHTSISQYIGRNQIECVNQHQYQDNPYGLTTQEMTILGLIAQGLSNKEIIESLFISMSTLKTHIVNIYRKLDIECNINSGSEMRVKATLKWLQFKDQIALGKQ